MPVRQVCKGCSEAARLSGTQVLAPRVRRLEADAVCWPHRDLGFQRVVIVAVQRRHVVDGAKLRVGHDKILREQSAGTEQPSVDDLARGLDRSDIRGVEKPRNSHEIAVRDIRSKRSMPAKRFGSGNVSADDADSGSEIQAPEIRSRSPVSHLWRQGPGGPRSNRTVPAEQRYPFAPRAFCTKGGTRAHISQARLSDSQ